MLASWSRGTRLRLLLEFASRDVHDCRKKTKSTHLAGSNISTFFHSCKWHEKPTNKRSTPKLVLALLRRYRKHTLHPLCHLPSSIRPSSSSFLKYRTPVHDLVQVFLCQDLGEMVVLLLRGLLEMHSCDGTVADIQTELFCFFSSAMFSFAKELIEELRGMRKYFCISVIHVFFFLVDG